MSNSAIAQINIAPLFNSDNSARRAVDKALFGAAQEIGFLTITGLPHTAAINEIAKSKLVQLFSLPQSKQKRLWKKNFEPTQSQSISGLVSSTLRANPEP